LIAAKNDALLIAVNARHVDSRTQCALWLAVRTIPPEHGNCSIVGFNAVVLRLERGLGPV